jgi:hypothetical protein
LLWPWRAITYIPSLPFARIFDFYYYIPVLGTALLYGVGAVELVRRIAPHLRRWWTRHYRPDPAEDD